MTDKPREFTLRGYLQVIRRQRWLILLTALICVAGALGYSLAQKATYTSTSSLTVNDPNQDLALLGSSYVTSETPLQLASIAARQANRPQVVAAVKRAVKPSPTASELSDLSIAVNPNSYAVQITASNQSASRAAAIANAFAHADVALTTSAARNQYAAQAAAVHRQLRHISPLSPQATTTEETYAHLRNLSSVATPLTVSAPATVPGSPSSPKTARNTFAALLIGLLLGVALGTARDALDRRLRHSPDVVEVLDHPVVGHIRAEALGHAGTSAEAADGLGPLAASDQESFGILRQNVRHMAAAGGRRTVLVTSPMAEEGKSTVAACLAAATAAAGLRTLLVECDMRRPVLAQRLGINAAPGLTDYLTGDARPQEVLQPVAGIADRRNGSSAQANGGQTASSLVCIVSGRTVPNPAELLSSERFHAFLGQVGQVYDSVILDTPPLLPVADTLAIVPDVSTLLVCVRLQRTTRDQARAAQSALDRLPQRPVGLVLTDLREKEDGYYYGYYGAPTAAGAASG